MSHDTLILGASGFIGRRMVERLGASRALATYHSHPAADGVRFDALSDKLASLGSSLATARHAFILFGVTHIDVCAREPARAAALNITATRSVIEQLVARGIVPVFASTDVVFDGARGGYREEDTPRPILTYGRQKLEIERFLEAHAPRHLILRLPKVIDDRPGDGGMLDDWLRAIDAGTPIDCATDQVFSPIALDEAVTAMIALIESGATGTYHLGGPTGWNRADLFDAFAEALHKHRNVAARMRRCSIRDFPQFAEARPLDITMNSEKLYRAIGFVPRDMTEVCVEFAASAATRRK